MKEREKAIDLDKERVKKAWVDIEIKQAKIDKESQGYKDLQALLKVQLLELEVKIDQNLKLEKDISLLEFQNDSKSSEIGTLQRQIQESTGNLTTETKQKVADVLGLDIEEWGKNKS